MKKNHFRNHQTCFILLFTITVMHSPFVWGQVAGNNLFGDSYLHEIRFMNADTNAYITTKDYQCLDMNIDGIALDSVGFKRKGNISFYHSTNKYPIKIKTNKYIPGKKYDGIKDFTLHINFQDPSMLREKLTYDICRELGLYSLRTAFAKVYINDVYWGLFTIAEGKDEMFKQVFDSRDMDAIESLDFGSMCFISQNPDDYNFEANGGVPRYILENGNPTTAWSRFAQMIEKANNTESDVYLDTVTKYLNLNDFFRLMAINVFLMNFDSYIAFRGNQIYAYDTVSNKWQIIPWDFNASFGLWNTNNYSPKEYPLLPAEIVDGCIASGLNANNTLFSYYMDAICQVSQIMSDTAVFFSKIESLKDQIKTAVYDDKRKIISNQDFDASTEYGYTLLFNDNIPALKTFIHERVEFIKQELNNLSYTCSGVSVNNIEDPGYDIEIYPNPAHNTIYIESFIPGFKITVLRIYNSCGQLVQIENQVIDIIDISSLSQGMYSLLLVSENRFYSTRFVKE